MAMAALMEYTEKDCFQCPYCSGCPDCAEFQKVAELKDAGIVIYKHTLRIPEMTDEIPAKAGTNDETKLDASEANTKAEGMKDVFILQNIKDVDITSADFMPEFEKKMVSCQRCQKLMNRTRRLLGNVAIARSDVKAVCDHCKTKQFRGTCFICDKIVKKFMDAKSQLAEEQGEMKTRFKIFLGKMQNLLQNTLEPEKKQVHILDSEKKQEHAFESEKKHVYKGKLYDEELLKYIEQQIDLSRAPTTFKIGEPKIELMTDFPPETEQTSIKEKKIKEKIKIQPTHEVIKEISVDSMDYDSLKFSKMRQAHTKEPSQDLDEVLVPPEYQTEEGKRPLKSSLSKPGAKVKEISPRKRVSRESLLSSFTTIPEDMSKKSLGVAFPKSHDEKTQDLKKKRQTMSSSELIKETQERLQSEADAKRKKEEEMRQMKIEEARRKRQAREEEKKRKAEEAKRKVEEEAKKRAKENKVKEIMAGRYLESSSDESIEIDVKTGRKLKKKKRRAIDPPSDESIYEIDKKTGKKTKKPKRRRSSTDSEEIAGSKKQTSRGIKSAKSEETIEKSKDKSKKRSDKYKPDKYEKPDEGKDREDRLEKEGKSKAKEDKTEKIKEKLRGKEEKETGKEKVGKEKYDKLKDEKEKGEKEKGEKEKGEKEKGEREKGEKVKGEKEKGDKVKGDKVKGEKVEGKESREQGKKEKGEKEKGEKEKGEKEKGDKVKGEKEKGDKVKGEKVEGKESREQGKIEKVKETAEKSKEKVEKEKVEKETPGKEKAEKEKIQKEHLRKMKAEKEKSEILSKGKVDKEKYEKGEKEKIDKETLGKAKEKVISEKDSLEKGKTEKGKEHKDVIEKTSKGKEEIEMKNKEKAEPEKSAKTKESEGKQSGDKISKPVSTNIPSGRDERRSVYRERQDKDDSKDMAESPDKESEIEQDVRESAEQTSKKKEPSSQATKDKRTSKTQTGTRVDSAYAEKKTVVKLDKNEVNMLNKALANQEKLLAGQEKSRKAKEEQFSKAHEAAEKTLKGTSDVKPFKEAVATMKGAPQKTIETKRQPSKSQMKPTPPVVDVDIKNIKTFNKSQDDLILKLVKVKKDENRKLPVLHIQALPDIPDRIRSRKKKSTFPANAVSEMELDLESLIRKKMEPSDEDVDEIIIGNEICLKQAMPPKTTIEKMPTLFKTAFASSPGVHDVAPTDTKSVPNQKKSQVAVTPKDEGKGILRYALSDRTFIEKGWTMLPTEKVVRKINLYRMRPSRPEFDWFERNKHKDMTYDTGERLADFDDNGRGRWYYRNGKIALNYYDCEEINAQQRYIIYSSGEPDDRGRSYPVTVLGMFDYIGNGVVFDHTGKIRLKYNQTEGVVLDRGIGPVTHWKWHSLNDPPILQQVMIDTHVAYKDPEIVKIGGNDEKKPREDNEEMLAIEFDNFIKEKSKKSSQTFKPFQIRMKALKINEHFSLRVLDQATIYLLFRDGSTNLKLNLGMKLDHQEIVDTDTAELGEVSNNIERLPAKTDSIRELQNFIESSKRFDRVRTEVDQRLRPTIPVASEDKLKAATSRALRPPLTIVPSNCSATNGNANKCRKVPANTLYYDTRLI